MKLPPDVKSAHANLSAENLSFLEHAMNNPEFLSSASFKNLEPDGRLMRFEVQPWPTFVDQSKMIEKGRIAVEICSLIKSIHERLFDNNLARMSEYYNLKPDFLEHVVFGGSNEKVFRAALARGDFINTPSGLKCVEFNMAGNLGGLWETGLRANLYLSNPVLKRYLEERNIRFSYTDTLECLFIHLTQQALEMSPYINGEINVAMAAPLKEPLHPDNIERFAKVYKRVLEALPDSPSGSFIVTDYSQLKQLNGKVYYKQKPIHLLMEHYSGNVPYHILRWFQRGIIGLLNGPVTSILCNKLNIALLSEAEESDAFDANEKKLIRMHVPWSRKVERGFTRYQNEKVLMEDLLIAKREDLVLKKAVSSSGVDVILGTSTPEDEWEAIANNILDENDWIVQERLDYLPYIYQHGDYGCCLHKVVWGLFVFGEAAGGCYLRMMPNYKKGIVNSAQGACEGFVFEVPDGPSENNRLNR